MACPSCARPVPEGARFCPSCGYALVRSAMEERRVVTVLFADLVGFTTLAEHRDPETVKRMIDRAFARLTRDVEAYGGRVDKVLGDGLVALFGAPVAHEDDAERAIRAALQMHETLCCFMEDHPADGELRMRIGINSGEVLVGSVAGTEYTAMGDVVNTASRLQALAPERGVVVGDATRTLCNDSIGFDQLAPAQLRGREQLEQAWLVTGVVAPAGRRHRPVTPFVGRHVERALLEAVTGLVAQGHGALVSVVGEAGIGKSRLVDEAVAEFRGEVPDAAIFEGASAPYGESNVWSPISSGIADYYGIDASQSAEQIRSIIGARSTNPKTAVSEQELEALLHVLGHPSELDRLDPAGARDVLFTSVITGFRRRAERGPVVIWLDDLQWSHALLRDLLGVLARSLADLPLLIITASRPSDDAEWLPNVDRALILQLPLCPLTEDESHTLVEMVTGRRPGSELAQRLYDRSGGNPLFLTELALMAAAGDDVGADTELPGSLRALIASRLDQLSAQERAVVDNAAILGTEGPIQALEEFAQALEQPFRAEVLDDLVALGLFEVHGKKWQFRSDVVREVAYQTLTRQARAQRHTGVAKWMASKHRASIDERAHHAAAAAELLEELGAVPGVPASITTEAIELLSEAARGSYDLGGFRHGAQLAERALGLAGDDEEVRRRLLLLHATGLVETRATAEARADLDEALSGAEAADDRIAEGEAHRLLGMVEQIDGHLTASRGHLGRSVDIFRELGDDVRLAMSLRARGFAEVFGGSLQDAEWYLGEADAIYERLGDLRGRAWIGQHRAWVAFLSGDNAEAEARLLDAVATFDSVGDHSGVTWARGLLAWVMYFERRFDEAEKVAEEVLVEARRWGDDWGGAMMHTLGASLRLWTGRFSESVTYAERALGGFKKIGDRFGAVQALAPLSRARVALGRTNEAERAMEELLALSDAFGEMAFPTIAASGVAMHLGRGERTVELASQAVDRMASTGASVDEARVQLSFGQLLCGRPEEALATLLDVDVASSPFALAARALANAATGDARAALADADAASSIDSSSYFDRCMALIAAAGASYSAGTPDAIARLDQMAAACGESGDVIVSAVGKALAHRLGPDAASPAPALPAGWQRVVEQLAAPAS